MTSLSYPEALEAVKAKVKASRTSFGAGMTVLPKARRDAMYAVYAFCRAVDDVADDSPSPEIAGRELQMWRHRIADVFQGKPTDEITAALLPAIQAFDLKEKDFLEIIDGMEMDAIAIVAPDLETLDTYCDRVASAVGRVSVRIFGDASEIATNVAHHLGRAFQLTNILRDLAEDAARGRLYLPRELLEKNGIIAGNPTDILKNSSLAPVCRDLAALALEHYMQADAFMKSCPRAAMLPARIMRLYYGAIFEKLLAADWREPKNRVGLSRIEKLWLLVKGLCS